MNNHIKYLVMDVDGTLTDGKIYMGNEGEVFKAYNIKDGCGIHDLLIPLGVTPVIITGRRSNIVVNRCKEIGIYKYFLGVVDKVKVLQKLLDENHDSAVNVAYIGDDINDLACMEFVKRGNGIVGCPQDATDKVKDISDFISTKSGGDGAVREFIEWLLI